MNTQEILKEIFKKAEKVVEHKMPNAFQYLDSFTFFEDGSLNAVFSWTTMGEYNEEMEEINLEDLDKDVDTLKAEHIQEVEKAKAEKEAQKQAKIEAERIAKEEREKAEYERLKNKYEA